MLKKDKNRIQHKLPAYNIAIEILSLHSMFVWYILYTKCIVYIGLGGLLQAHYAVFGCVHICKD